MDQFRDENFEKRHESQFPLPVSSIIPETKTPTLLADTLCRARHVVDGQCWTGRQWLAVLHHPCRELRLAEVRNPSSLVSAPAGRQGLGNKKSADTGPSGKHVVFGEVIEGLDVVKQIEKVGSRDGKVSSSRKAIIKDCGVVE